MNTTLSGRLAFVSGSTAGIGQAIALELARLGAEVIINGRTEARVEKAVAEIAASSVDIRLRGFAADLGTAEGCEAAAREFPHVDVLVNNLGIFEPKPFEQIPDEDWLRFFQVNVMSGVRLSRSFLPGMRERRWGRILFVSSESAVQIPSEMIHYGMTKTAQVAIARGLAETCVGTGVTINSILVGPTASEGVNAFIEALAKDQGQSPKEFEAEFFRTVRPTSLLKRFIDPTEIASVAAFLCSPAASAITGAAVRADGGLIKAAL